ncbi:MAG: hypothetical protein LBJ08_00345 [Bifidobacteriaceae bacterium]|jgi:hypothetical protein|nr:hypothetical protein [Bifidobacteriaceae bacterium]
MVAPSITAVAISDITLPMVSPRMRKNVGGSVQTVAAGTALAGDGEGRMGPETWQ